MHNAAGQILEAIGLNLIIYPLIVFIGYELQNTIASRIRPEASIGEEMKTNGSITCSAAVPTASTAADCAHPCAACDKLMPRLFFTTCTDVCEVLYPKQGIIFSDGTTLHIHTPPQQSRGSRRRTRVYLEAERLECTRRNFNRFSQQALPVCMIHNT